MTIFKKLKLYFFFKKTLKQNKTTLLSRFFMKIDRASRIYTILNIPEKIINEPYNLRKSDIDTISEKYLREYISELSEYLNSIGLSELYDFYDPIDKVGKYSFLVIIGFKPFNSVFFNKIIYFWILPILSLILIIYFLFFVLY